MKKEKNYVLNLRHLFLNKITASLFTLTFLFVSVFLITRGVNASTSELAFIERSVKNSIVGSVIPASCDSAPPQNHVAGDCPNPIVTLSGLPYTQSYGAVYGGISWSSSNATYCEAYRNGSLLSTVGTSGSLDAVARYANTFYNITCYNAVGIAGDSGAKLLTVAPRVTLGFGGTIPPTPAPPAPLTPLSLTSDTEYVMYGDMPTLYWNNTGATSCTASGSWSGGKNASGGSQTLSSYSGTRNTTRTYTLSCTNGTYSTISSVTVYFEGAYMDACFTAGTKVTLADGREKNIEDVTIDDTLMTSGGPQEVMKRYVIPYHGRLYAFNGSGNYFVSPTHPFMTTKGWKSINPEGTRRESPGLEVSKLAVGDTLIMKDGKTLLLTQLDSEVTSTTVYNFGINGTHDYYADGYLVHNVDMNYLPIKTVEAAQAKN